MKDKDFMNSLNDWGSILSNTYEEASGSVVYIDQPNDVSVSIKKDNPNTIKRDDTYCEYYKSTDNKYEIYMSLIYEPDFYLYIFHHDAAMQLQFSMVVKHMNTGETASHVGVIATCQDGVDDMFVTSADDVSIDKQFIKGFMKRAIDNLNNKESFKDKQISEENLNMIWNKVNTITKKI